MKYPTKTFPKRWRQARLGEVIQEQMSHRFFVNFDYWSKGKVTKHRISKLGKASFQLWIRR